MTKQIIYFVYRSPFPITKLVAQTPDLLNWTPEPMIWDIEVVGDFPICQAKIPYGTNLVGEIEPFFGANQFVFYISDKLAIEYLNTYYSFFSNQDYIINGTTSTGYLAYETLPQLDAIANSGFIYMSDNGYSFEPYDPNYEADGYTLAPTAVDVTKDPVAQALLGIATSNLTDNYYMLVFDTDYANKDVTNVIVSSTGSVSISTSTNTTIEQMQNLSESLAIGSAQTQSFETNGEVIATEINQTLSNITKSVSNAFNVSNPTFDIIMGGLIIAGIVAIAIVLK